MTEAEAVESLKKLIDNDTAFQELSDKMFDDLDSDKSGFIDPKEVKPMLINDLGTEPTDDDIRDCLKMIDTNQDGKIDKKELATFLKELFKAIIAAAS